MRMASAKLSCKRAVVGIRWAESYPGCMNRLRKRYSQGGSFLAGKGLGSERAFANRMLINEWARLRSQVRLLNLKVSVLESELRQK